jgi:hypothetical protein
MLTSPCQRVRGGHIACYAARPTASRHSSRGQQTVERILRYADGQERRILYPVVEDVQDDHGCADDEYRPWLPAANGWLVEQACRHSGGSDATVNCAVPAVRPFRRQVEEEPYKDRDPSKIMRSKCLTMTANRFQVP